MTSDSSDLVMRWLTRPMSATPKPGSQALSRYRRAGFVAREEGTGVDVLFVRPGGAG